MSEEYLKRQYEIIRIILAETNAYLTEAASYIEITLKHLTDSNEEYSKLIRKYIDDVELENDIYYKIRLKSNDRKHETENSIYFNNEFSLEQALEILDILDKYLDFISNNFTINFKYEKFNEIYKKEIEHQKQNIVVEEKVIEKIVEKEVPIIKNKIVKKEVPVIKEKIVKKTSLRGKIIIILLILLVLFLIYVCFNMKNIIEGLKNIDLIKDEETVENDNSNKENIEMDPSQEPSNNDSSLEVNPNYNENIDSCSTCEILPYHLISNEEIVYDNQYDFYYSDKFGYIPGASCVGSNSMDGCIIKLYSSSNPDVAEIHGKSGLVKVNGIGETTLTECFYINYNNQKVCNSGKLVVKSADIGCKVTFDDDNIKESTLDIYESVNYNSKFKTYVFTVDGGCEYYVDYFSSNENVATVDSNGKITANSIGEASISKCVMSKDTNNKLGCQTKKLNVIHHNYKMSCSESFMNSIGVGSTLLRREYGVVNISYLSGCDLTYESSNNNIATVDSNGDVTGISPGKVTIKAKWIEKPNYIIDTCEWTINVI